MRIQPINFSRGLLTRHGLPGIGRSELIGRSAARRDYLDIDPVKGAFECEWALFLSRNTVQTHVSHILAKLGARSRVEVVTQAEAHASSDRATA